MTDPTVLHSITTVYSGGVERRHAMLVEQITDVQHVVVCPDGAGPVFDSMLTTAVGVTTAGRGRGPFSPARIRAVSQSIRQWRPQIVHGAVIDGYVLGSLVGRAYRTPAVLLEETSDPTNRSAAGHKLARLAAAAADHCIAVSPAVKAYLVDRGGVPARKISVISNGVGVPTRPLQRESAQLRRGLKIAESSPVIGSVGRMHDKTKRFGDLIEAFSRLRGEPHLILVGDGAERPALETLAHDLDIADRVHFVGFQREPGRYYALMDIFALASERESFGLVNAEAMRCALPVVATRVGGIPDVVAHDHTGILVPPRDIPGITNALQTLIDNPELRHRMGTAGKQRADTHFSAERYVNDVHQLYQHLLADPRR